MRARVTFVVDYLHPTLGMQRSLLNLADLLSDEWDVQIVAMSGPVPEISLPAETLADLRARSRRRGILALFRHMNRLERDSQVVVLVGVWAALPWLLRRRSPRRPTVIWEHSLMRERFRIQRRMQLWDVCARVLYRRAQEVVAVSEPLALDLRRYCTNRVTTVHNLTPIERPKIPTSRPTSRRLITIGTLSALKRQEVCIRALACLPSDWTLDVVGEGAERPRLEQLVRELRLENRVTFHGYVGNPDVVTALLAQAEVMVHAAVAETFGLVMVEAAQAGVEVVACRNRSSQFLVPEYVPGALFMPNDSPQRVADLITGSRGLETAVWRAAAARRSALLDPQVIRAQWEALLRRHTGTTAPKESDSDQGTA